MNVDEKHEQWRAITESDFVTLFIKTWFTYIAVLRRLNPDVQVFTAEGLPRGDKPFLNAFQNGIMPIVQKKLPVDSIIENLFDMYPIGMKKVIKVFPQYFFQTFFRINEEFNFENIVINKDDDGNIKERYHASIKNKDRFKLSMYLGISGKYRTKSYNEKIKGTVDLRPIIESAVSHQQNSDAFDEYLFFRDVYEGIINQFTIRLRQYIDNTLPQRGYNPTINLKITNSCMRLLTEIRLKFDYNYRYPHEVEVLRDFNSYAVFSQMPFNLFGNIESSNVISSNKDYYYRLISTKGIEWFSNYVYALRNALFHEIISPLDEEWQAIFKSAYLVLKQVSDICISYISQICDFPTIQDNPVIKYAEEHAGELFSDLADSVEVLSFSEINLSRWIIDDGAIQLSGWFKVKLKLQNSDNPEAPDGTQILEEDKGYSYDIFLDEDFRTKLDEEDNERIQIRIQESLPRGDE